MSLPPTYKPKPPKLAIENFAADFLDKRFTDEHQQPTADGTICRLYLELRTYLRRTAPDTLADIDAHG